MKKLIAVVSLYFINALLGSAQGLAADCRLAYDEFDNLMNKEFLIKPSKFVTTVNKRLSRYDYNAKQKGRFLLSRKHKGSGIGIVRTNSNQRGKFLFTWGTPFENGNPTLIIKKAVIHRLVTSGDNPLVWSNIKVKSSFTLDLDTGRIGGSKADIWFHNIDGKTMYVEAINGADLAFPLQSLCKPALSQVTAVPTRVYDVRPAVTAVREQATVNVASQSPSKSSSCSAKTIVRREITAGGGARITYSDGSTETFNGDGVMTSATIVLPDGTMSSMSPKTAAPTDIVVEPPAAPLDSEQAQWLERHRQSLLDIIQSMVSEPDSVQNVLAELDTSENTYESITTRSKIIKALASPNN